MSKVLKALIFGCVAAVTMIESSTSVNANSYTFYGEATQTIQVIGGPTETIHGYGNLTYYTNASNNNLTFSNGVYSGSDSGLFGGFEFGNLPGITQNSDYSGTLDKTTGAVTLTGTQFAFHLDGNGAVGGGTFITDAFGFTSNFGANPPTPGTVLTWSGTNQLNVYAYAGGQKGPLVAYSEDRTITVLASPVPEPSTFALLGLGGIGLAIGAYRRRRMASV